MKARINNQIENKKDNKINEPSVASILAQVNDVKREVKQEMHEWISPARDPVEE